MSLWDEIEVGATRNLGAHRFTADAIKDFAAKYDPQAFHLDEAAAEASLLGGLCASGWHTAAVFQRLHVDDLMRTAERQRASGRPLPVIGPSPGFRNLRWPRPVHAGDTIRFVSVIGSKRLSESRPGWGIVETANSGTNEAGEIVFSVDTTGFIGIS